MTAYYDLQLRNIFPANNDKSDVVLNNYFEEWTDHIEKNLITRFPSGGNNYESGKDKELLNLCNEHVAEYGSNIESDNVITLTHPFYMHLTHMEYVTDRTKKDAKKYLNNLSAILNSELSPDCTGFVVFETIHHYAALTSLLLESGLIEKVIFTEYSGGKMLDFEEINFLKEKEIFAGGGYNGLCFTSSFKTILDIVDSEKQVHAISDLILNPPQVCYNTLIPKKIASGYGLLRDEQIITSSQLLEKFDGGQFTYKAIKRKVKKFINPCKCIGFKSKLS